MATRRELVAYNGRAVSRSQPGGTLGTARDRWRGLSLFTRRRLVTLGGLIVLVALLVVVAIPNLPCQFPGGDSCPPPDDAAEIIPAGALAYVHANLDPETEQVERATAILDAVPRFSGELIDRAAASLGVAGQTEVDFESEIRPWFGGELAIAILNSFPEDERVVALEVSDEQGAEEYASEVIGPGARTEEHEGVQISVDGDGLATAQVDEFLLIGAEGSVRSVIDTATGVEGAESLAGDATAGEVRDELPDHRLAEAYLSDFGAAELVGDVTGPLAPLSALVSPGSTRGAAAALTVGEADDLQLAVRSVLDPERASETPGFFAAFPGFEPTLPERLTADAFGYVGIGDPGETVGALLDQAAVQAPGVVSGFEDLAATLERESDVDIEGELLAGLGSEAAFSLEPRPDDAAADSPAVPGTAGVPYLQFVAEDVDEDQVRTALASLQGPLAAAVDLGSGLQAPVFTERELAGVEATSLRLSPVVELTYAVFDDLAAIATDPAGIERLAGADGGLEEAATFERATEDFEDEVSLLAFLDLDRLIGLAEGLGLAEDPVYAAFAGEFRRLDAFGLAVVSEPQLLATDARLLFGEPPEVEPAASPVVPPD